MLIYLSVQGEIYYASFAVVRGLCCCIGILPELIVLGLIAMCEVQYILILQFFFQCMIFITILFILQKYQITIKNIKRNNIIGKNTLHPFFLFIPFGRDSFVFEALYYRIQSTYFLVSRLIFSQPPYSSFCFRFLLVLNSLFFSFFFCSSRVRRKLCKISITPKNREATPLGVHCLSNCE